MGARTFYRVALTGFRDARGAATFKDGLAASLGFRTPWAVEQ